MGLGSALATGAAVGLGAVAVEAAVRHFAHRDEQRDDARLLPNHSPAFANNLGPDTDRELGGTDFGITDTDSWDSGGR